MERQADIIELGSAISARSAAYAEEAAARDALDEAERRLKAAAHATAFDNGFDAALSATLRGREAIARVRREKAIERLREARRDLQRARQLAAPETVRDTE